MSSCREIEWCGKIGDTTKPWTFQHLRNGRERGARRGNRRMARVRRETKRVLGAVSEHLLNELGMGVTKVSYQNEAPASEELKTKDQAAYLYMKR